MVIWRQLTADPAVSNIIIQQNIQSLSALFVPIIVASRRVEASSKECCTDGRKSKRLNYRDRIESDSLFSERLFDVIERVSTMIRLNLFRMYVPLRRLLLSRMCSMSKKRRTKPIAKMKRSRKYSIIYFAASLGDISL